MSLSRWAVQYKPIVISGIILAMVWGLVAFNTMPRREDPEFTIRVCVVSTTWPGAPTETVEELVAAGAASTPWRLSRWISLLSPS